jgi:hypothetical protein
MNTEHAATNAAFLAALQGGPATAPAGQPKRLGYVRIPGVVNLSFSKLSTFYTCPRKYMLGELEGMRKFNPSAHTAFGHSYGAGIQEYARWVDKLGHDKAVQRAVVGALAAWDTYSLDDVDAKGIKSFWRCTQAVALWCEREGRRLLEVYELANLELNGRTVPGIELEFYVHIGEHYNFQGHIDLVLRHRQTGELCVVEIKTMSKPPAPADWANSAQTIGYNVVLQGVGAMAAEQVAYHVLYLCYDASAMELTELPFSRSLAERSEWVTSLLADVQQMEMYKELGVWPKRGSQCMNYKRACEFFGICDLSHTARSAPDIGSYEDRALEDVHFVTRIEDLLELQERELAAHEAPPLETPLPTPPL